MQSLCGAVVLKQTLTIPPPFFAIPPQVSNPSLILHRSIVVRLVNICLTSLFSPSPILYVLSYTHLSDCFTPCSCPPTGSAFLRVLGKRKRYHMVDFADFRGSFANFVIFTTSVVIVYE